MISIGNRPIGENHPVFIIAEAGVNHNGDLQLAKKLVEVAAEAGADAVKFQTFKTENIILPQAPKSTYHVETTGNEQSWFDLLKSQELTREMHVALIEHCKKVGIMFLSTPYDEESADLLDELDVPGYKIASTDANNVPFLKYIARKKRPMILSTAMCSFDEVRESVEAIRAEGLKDLIVLHCTGNYPAKLQDSNLRAMLTLKKQLNVPVGYSDHVLDPLNCIAAIAMGAVVYEKHFTMDKNLPGPDHRASLNPAELTEMVQMIRKTEQAMGSAEKRVLPSEAENRQKLRKSVVTRVSVRQGERLTAEMLAIKRPGTGFRPADYDKLIGQVVTHDLPMNHVLNSNDLVDGKSLR